MTERKNLAAIATAAALLGLSACVSGSEPPTAPKPAIVQDVEFVRGCWVRKDAPGGPALGFLRLLPKGADGPAYEGQLHNVTDPSMPVRSDYSFRRDGSSMTFKARRSDARTYAAAPIPDAIAPPLAAGSKRASFAIGPAAAGWLIADGGAETLRIYTMFGDGRVRPDWFNGERDGCD
ncbi:MAG: hypothetical protein Q8R02_12080 [Hyphomonadaceae bacterium]|nr:hypothetical protein [Hyphomonadaceae bacterium]